MCSWTKVIPKTGSKRRELNAHLRSHHIELWATRYSAVCTAVVNYLANLVLHQLVRGATPNMVAWSQQSRDWTQDTVPDMTGWMNGH